MNVVKKRENKNLELISNCNKILLKYMSIESILYNQLMLENLLEDYKWNNPHLNNISNNILINKIQNIQDSLL